MAIQALTIRRFRNLEDQNFLPSAGLNVLEGDNAQGKTNLLEAIYYLANGKSFRAAELPNLIRFDSASAELSACWEQEGLDYRLEVQLRPEGRELKFQGKPIVRLAPVQSSLRVLVFTPDSSQLFRLAPLSRRRYFDHAIAVQSPSYASALSRYQRVLRQRNHLLESGAPSHLLEPFDRQWAETAAELLSERRAYLERLLPIWKKRWRALSGEDWRLSAAWAGPVAESRIGDPEALLEALTEVGAEERRQGRSLLGPQREDLVLALEDHPVREAASQGQQRMLVIGLKLAEADLFRENSRRAPVFLLDDLGSELDERHRRLLLESLGEIEAQTFLTSAQSGAYAALHARNFRVESGRISA
ncbi:MAG TPA: DNA replication/repair protein RecF [bacterium]|nr:DNA replication/repair protein RecF [bacterium]